MAEHILNHCWLSELKALRPIPPPLEHRQSSHCREGHQTSMICAGTWEACSRTSSFLLHSLIINPLSFLTAIHFGISLIYSPRQLHILSLQGKGKTQHPQPERGEK